MEMEEGGEEEGVYVSNFIDDMRSKFKLPGRIRIFDTTLRDGEQTPGISLTPSKKLQIARMLDQLGVDVIEAGFAAVSEGEHEAIKLIASGSQLRLVLIAIY